MEKHVWCGNARWKIFSDTILNNIVLDDEQINYTRLREVCRIAQIEDEINAMPKGFETTIGETGRGLSGGQKQRLLIARALYRDPKFLFMDEATNSLDSINERKIVNALNNAFEQRTVVVIAHRLSTIRNADQIVVLDKGFIVETGTHEILMEKRGIILSWFLHRYKINGEYPGACIRSHCHNTLIR